METRTKSDWFFVYVVESPSAPDLYHDRSERQLLAQALQLAQIPCASHCAITREAFQASLDVGLKDAIARFSPKVPILHLSSHGNREGIQLSSGESMTWAELGELLTPINGALDGKLIVSMSCCEGYSGVRMAMKTDDSPLPFFALVGSSETPLWSETALAFAVYYHRLVHGAHVSTAVEAMNIGSGCNHFHVQWAEDSKRSYIDFLQTYDSSRAQRQLAAASTVRQMHDLEKRALTVMEPLRRAA